MIDISQVKVGTKLVFIKDVSHYKKGAVIEVASFNRVPNGYAFSFHGIFGQMWGYKLDELIDLKRRYPHGNFSLLEKELSALDFFNTEWDI